jgi:gliding motility-associated-like protein
VNFEFTYCSHGAQSNGSFAPKIYTHGNGNFQEEGIINASYIETLPAAGTAWETHTAQWTVTGAMAGDNWIFLYTDASSGMVFNICQMQLEPAELSQDIQLEGCELTGLLIGEEIAGDVDYSWNSGGQDAFITANSTGSYILTATNSCNSDSRLFLVSLQGEPELMPDGIEDVIFCEGDSLEISSSGLNVLNTWPDGTSTDTFWLSNEQTYTFTIEDDCGIVPFEFVIDFDTIPYIDLGPDRILCEGQSYTLDGSVAGDVEYLWATGSTDPWQLVDHEDVYELTLQNDCGSYTDEVIIEYNFIPESIIDSVVYFCKGRLPEFDLNEYPGTFEWSDGSTGPYYTAQFLGVHWVDYTDDKFCFTFRDSVIVFEDECSCPIYLPTAFTPDSDGINDIYRCEFECPPYDFTLEIYDRWGNVAFRTNSPDLGWDGDVKGKTAPMGVYQYRMWYRESFSGIPIEKFGLLSLIGGPFEN